MNFKSSYCYGCKSIPMNSLLCDWGGNAQKQWLAIVAERNLHLKANGELSWVQLSIRKLQKHLKRNRM